jgi:predicted O-methyltransferase YrrM
MPPVRAESARRARGDLRRRHAGTFGDHAAQARKHFAEAGVDQRVTVVEGDAHQNVKRLKESIDVLCLDADKEGYTDYLNRLLPLVRPGGLILAHNFDQAGEYGRAVSANPELETLVTGSSLAVTLRKR